MMYYILNIKFDSINISDSLLIKLLFIIYQLMFNYHITYCVIYDALFENIYLILSSPNSCSIFK